MRRLLLVLSPLTLAVLFAVPAAPALAGTGQHAAITISSNAGFSSCGCVTSGTGTAASPYIIGPWAIGAPSGGTSGWSVKIDNSHGKITDYFNIFGISSTYNDTSTTDPTIWLVDVKTATTISGNSANPTAGNDLGIGIELDGSSNVSIDGVSYNKGNGTGVYLNGSSNVSINNSKFKATCDVCTPHTGDGIYAVNSANLQIGTGADCPANGPCNDVTYDDGFGIWLVNTHDVVINHATADANDTGGYVLDGFGGLHPFAIGGRPVPVTPVTTGYWKGWNIINDVVLVPGTHSGYVLDGFGGLHPFAQPGSWMPLPVSGLPYWRGWNIARSVWLLPSSTWGAAGGYVLDGFGGLHRFGTASSTPSFAYSPGHDLAIELAGF